MHSSMLLTTGVMCFSSCCLYFPVQRVFNLTLLSKVDLLFYMLLLNWGKNKTMTGTEQNFFCYYHYWCFGLFSFSPGWPRWGCSWGWPWNSDLPFGTAQLLASQVATTTPGLRDRAIIKSAEVMGRIHSLPCVEGLVLYNLREIQLSKKWLRSAW